MGIEVPDGETALSRDSVRARAMSVIYILAHPTNSSVCKIGQSSVSALSRIGYQSIAWQVAHEFGVAEILREQAEKYIHAALAHRNVNVGIEGPQEIYTISPEEAVGVVQSLLEEFSREILRGLVQITPSIKSAQLTSYLDGTPKNDSQVGSAASSTSYRMCPKCRRFSFGGGPCEVCGHGAPSGA